MTANAGTTVSFGGRDSGLNAAQRRAERGQNGVTEAARRTGRTSQQVGQQQQKSFGGVIAKLGGVMAAFVGYQAVIGKVGQAFEFMNREQDKAVRTAEALVTANRRLSQVATSAEDYDALERRADDLAMRYGEKRAIAREVVFSARSEEDFSENDLDAVMKYGDVVSPLAQAKVAGSIPRLFGEKMGAEETVSMGLVAAGESVADFEAMAELLPIIAEGGGLQGASSEESLAAGSVFAGLFGGKTSAQRLKILATKLSQSEFKGEGLTGGVEAMMGADESVRGDFLGENSELITAYETYVKQLALIKQREAKIFSERQAFLAGEESTLAKKWRWQFSEKTQSGRRNMALEEKRKAEQREEIMNERQSAEDRALQDAAHANAMSVVKEQGVGGIRQFIGSQVGGAARRLGLDDSVVSGAVMGGAAFAPALLRGGGAALPGETAELGRFMAGLQAATEEQTEVIKAGQQTPSTDQSASGPSLRGSQLQEAATTE